VRHTNNRSPRLGAADRGPSGGLSEATVTQTSRGGRAKTKNGKGVYQSPNGKNCYKTANSHGCN
jgi:hypothetical protein